MGLWSSISGAFSRAVRGDAAPTVGLTTRLQPWLVPPQRGSKQLIEAYRTEPWLRAAAHRTGTAVSSVKLRLLQGTGKNRKELEAHPLLTMLTRRPNPVLSARAQRRLTQTHYDLLGDAVWVKERNRKGEVVQLVPVPPHWFRSFPGQRTPNFEISWRDAQISIRPEDAVWFHDPDPADPFARGAGLAESLADELDTDEFVAKYVKTYFFNRATPEIIASWEGADLTTLKKMEADWDAKFRGTAKANRTLFTGGKVKVERLDTVFRDMQLVELRGAVRDIIISVWGVPPEIMGVLSSSNRATIEAADLIMAKSVVLPRIQDFVDTLNSQLLPEFGDDLELAFDDPTPEDRPFRLSVMQARPQAFKDNELRKLGGFEETKEGDAYPPALPALAPTQLSADPPWVRDLARMLSAVWANSATRGGGDGSFDENAIPNVLEALRPERLIAELQPVMQARVEAWAKNELGDLGQAGKFDLLNPLIPKFIDDEATERISGLVNGTTRDQLKASLTEGVRAGEGIDDLLDRVEDVFTVADQSRAENIARTEVLRASNWATHEAQKVSGVVDERAWVSTRDGRTRAEHLALDGVKAKLDKPFSIDGHEAMYPGGFGDPALDCQCRCTTVAVISDDLGDDELAMRRRAVKADATTEDLDRVWRAYDAALVPWETEAEKALRRGFSAQLSDVRKALRSAAK